MPVVDRPAWSASSYRSSTTVHDPAHHRPATSRWTQRGEHRVVRRRPRHRSRAPFLRLRREPRPGGQQGRGDLHERHRDGLVPPDLPIGTVSTVQTDAAARETKVDITLFARTTDLTYADVVIYAAAVTVVSSPR